MVPDGLVQKKANDVPIVGLVRAMLRSRWQGDGLALVGPKSPNILKYWKLCVYYWRIRTVWLRGCRVGVSLNSHMGMGYAGLP